MAKKIEGIMIKIDGSTSGLDKAIKGLNGELTTTNKELRQVDTGLKFNPNSVELLSQKSAVLAQNVQKLSEKFNTLQSVKEQVDRQFAEGQISDEQYRAFNRELEKTEDQLKRAAEAQRNFDGDLKNAQGVLGENIRKLDEFGNKAQDVGSKMQSAGKKMSVVSAGIAAAGVASAKTAIDFESSFAGVRKTVEATEEEYEKLRQGILDMSGELPASANSIAAVAEAAGQLGIENENILSFTRTMIDLGEATNLSAEEAATSFARFANITGMAQTDFDKMGSSVVALGNNLATTESEIVAMSMRLAGAGAQVGMTESQIAGLAAALSSVGIEADAGGSAMSKVMVNMQLAAETGGTALENFANVAGVSAAEFKQAYEKDAAGALVSFVTGLQDTDRLGKSAIAVLDEMGISEVRMRDALLRAAGAGDLFNDAIELSNKAWEENAALGNEAEQRYATTASQLKILANDVKAVAIGFGEVLLPTLKEIVASIKNVIERFENLDDGAKKFIITIAAIVAAIGPVTVAIGTFVRSVGAIASAIGPVASLIAKIGPLVQGVATMVMAALKPLFAFLLANPVVAVIAAVIAAVVLLYTKCEWFRDGVNAILAAVVGFFKNLGSNIATIFESIKTSITEKIEAIKVFLTQRIPEIVKTVANKFAEIPQKLRAIGRNLIMGLWNGISDKVDWIISKIKGFGNAVLNAMKSIFGIDSPSKETRKFGLWLDEGLGKGINKGAKSVIDEARNLGDNVLTAIQNALPDMVNMAGVELAYAGAQIDAKEKTTGLDQVSALVNALSSLIPQTTERPMIENHVHIGTREVAREIYDPLENEKKRRGN